MQIFISKVLYSHTVECVHACSVVSNSATRGLQPTRLLCAWDSSGKNTVVVCHCPSPGFLLDRRIEPASPALRQISTHKATWEAQTMEYLKQQKRGHYIVQQDR